MSSPLRALSPGSSLSSYDYFSSHSRRASRDASSEESYGTVSDDASSDDEIVLSFSDISALDVLSQRGDDPRSPAVFSDDEFVIMSRPRTPREDDLATTFSALSVGTSGARSAQQSSASSSSSSSKSSRRRVKKKRAAAGAPDNDVPSPSASPVKASKESPKSQSPSKAKRRARRTSARAASVQSFAALAGLGDRPIVDDVSEAGTEYSALYVPPAVYESAQTYVSS